jgi:hypothetical protein
METLSHFGKTAACVAGSLSGGAIMDLNNPTVAAVAGGVVTAVATYLVVALTDWRRALRKARKGIRAQLQLYRVLVRSRIEGAQAALKTVPGDSRLLQDIGDRFPAERIRKLAEDDHLRPEQAMALYNLAFSMEQSDERNSRALTQIASRRRGPNDTERTVSDEQTRGDLLMTYSEELMLLRRAEALIDAYLSDRIGLTGGPL